MSYSLTWPMMTVKCPEKPWTPLRAGKVPQLVKQPQAHRSESDRDKVKQTTEENGNKVIITKNTGRTLIFKARWSRRASVFSFLFFKVDFSRTLLNAVDLVTVGRHDRDATDRHGKWTLLFLLCCFWGNLICGEKYNFKNSLKVNVAVRKYVLFWFLCV